MAIKVENAEVQPQLVYDQFFLEELKLMQKMDADHSATSHYTLKVRYRLFAVDHNAVRHFKTRVDTIDIDNYLAVGLAKAMAGDPDLLEAAKAIEKALAVIIADQTDLGTAMVV